MRLDKFLANMGKGSRKEIRIFVKAGIVTIDGKPAKSFDQQIDPEKNIVKLKGELVQYKPFVYLMMNKPAGVLSATEDSHGKRTAVDLVGEEYSMYDLSPAGRLDLDTEGFLLLTNDGDYIHNVISPKKKCNKKYYARVSGKADADAAQKFENGLVLRDGTECQPAKLEFLSDSEIYVTIHEGKFHQVKKMSKAVGLEVEYLKRLSIGGVALDETLGPGEYRELTAEEKETIVHE